MSDIFRTFAAKILFIETTMQTAALPKQVFLTIPSSDYRLISTLSQKMGWTIHRTRKSGLQKALDDVQAGRVYEAKDIDDLMAQLEA